MAIATSKFRTRLFAGIALFTTNGMVIAADATAVDISAASIKKLQAAIDEAKSSAPNVQVISIHAKQSDGKTTKIASTKAAGIGSPSDPEDIEAIANNKVVVIEDKDLVDVTVPMSIGGGKPLAVAGIKIVPSSGTSTAAVQKQAEEIAKKLQSVLVASP